MKKLFLATLFTLLFLFFLNPFSTFAASYDFNCTGSTNTTITVDPYPIIVTPDTTPLEIKFTISGNLATGSTYYLDSLEWLESEKIEYTGEPLTITKIFRDVSFSDSKIKLMRSTTGLDQSLCQTTEKVIVDNEAIKIVTPVGSCNATISPNPADINDSISVTATGLEPSTQYSVLMTREGVSGLITPTTQAQVTTNSSGSLTTSLGTIDSTGSYHLSIEDFGIPVCKTNDALEIQENILRTGDPGYEEYLASLAQADPTCNSGKGIDTAIGCLPTNVNDFVKDIIQKRAIPLGAGFAFLLMLYGAFTLITSAGNPESTKKGQEIITSAIVGLLFIIFSVFLLKVIGVDILQLDKFGF